MKLILIIILAIHIAGCHTIPEPRLGSVAASATETQLLEQTRRLFGEGKYSEARRKAEQVLELNPASADALFAIAACHFGVKEYRESIAVSRQAARYRSELLPDIYLLLGAAYERIDEAWNALRTYRHASRRFPDNAIVQQRLALVYIHLEKPELAAEALKNALRLEPLDPNSHFQLGMLYADYEYRIPALLALSVALLVDPGEGPVDLINETLDTLLGQGVIRNAASGAFVSVADAAPKSDEGDFAATDAALTSARVALLNRGVRGEDPAMLNAQYNALFTALRTLDSAQGGEAFAVTFYVPLFRALTEKGLQEAFINSVFQVRQDPVFAQWIADHPGQATQLQATMRHYRWSGGNTRGR